MNILGVDLGTHTGIATLTDGVYAATTKTWASAKQITEFRKRRMDRRSDPRVLEFHRQMRLGRGTYDLVVFEDVQFSNSTLQTQLWSSFRAALWLAFQDDYRALVDCVPTGTLKLFATGHGGSDKDRMAKYLRLQHPDLFKPEYDDNAIDALWLVLWAERHLGRTPCLTKPA